MRNKWEDKADEEVDEPVTITESQLRSLKRGARVGLISLFLALVAVGVAGWAWFQGTKKSSSSDLVKAAEPAAASPVATEPAAVAPANSAPSSSSSEAAPVAAAPSTSERAPAARATRVSAASAVNASASGRTSRRAQAARSVGRAKYGANAVATKPSRAAASRSEKPKTETFDGSMSAPAPVLPPAPVNAEPAKPAAKDSTSSH